MNILDILSTLLWTFIIILFIILYQTIFSFNKATNFLIFSLREDLGAINFSAQR